MSRQIAILLVALVAIAMLWTTPTEAKVLKSGDRFYNYHGPTAMDGTAAQLYVSPRPVPPYVGHTYITYEPLRPHEYMYRHYRTYVRGHGYGNGGITTTTVRYGHLPQPFMRCYPLCRGVTDLLNQGCH